MQAMHLAFAFHTSNYGRGGTESAMTTGGQQKLFAYILALLGLGLFLFGVVVLELPHQTTPASAFLTLAGGCLLAIAPRLYPRKEGEEDEPGLLASWMNGSILMMFAGILLLLAYGLWTMFTGG